MSDTAFAGRTAIVTGASAGIGEAVVRLLASRSCRVVANARRAEKLEQLAQSLTPLVRPVAGDCAEDGVIGAMLDAAASLSGVSREADLVVINAGRGLNGSVMTSDPSQWEEMIRTNFLGAAKLLRGAATRMLKEIGAPGGAPLDCARDIVILGSTVGRHVSPFSSMYGSTKFGLHGLAEGARRELGPKGIRVSLIEPGFVESEFQGVAGYNPEWVRDVFARIGPVLQPQDVAKLVGFICEQPAHVHISDQLIRPTRQDYP